MNTENAASKPFAINLDAASRGHFLAWSRTGEGMSISGEPGKAAFIEGGGIMLISKDCIERGSLPPGFVRYLTSEEAKAQGAPFMLFTSTEQLIALYGDKYCDAGGPAVAAEIRADCVFYIDPKAVDASVGERAAYRALLKQIDAATATN